MISRTAIVVTLALLLSCGTEQKKNEKNNGQQKNAPQNGGNCEYFDVNGDAKITDISEKDPYDAFNVRISLEFRPSNPDDLLKIQGLVVGSSNFATIAALTFKRICIEANNVEVDSNFPMSIKKISKGTCNPTIFRFLEFSDGCEKL